DGGCGGHSGGAAGGPSLAVLRVGRGDVPPRLSAADVLFFDLTGAPMQDEARIALALVAGVPGSGGAGGAVAGCGDAAEDGPPGHAAPIGCCRVVGLSLSCGALHECDD
ncbi:MAG: hypothetical protein KC620_13835, partial [Myxococcales bacterium]|nr:hypothetical protein [Myxococcales bacterium]